MGSPVHVLLTFGSSFLLTSLVVSLDVPELSPDSLGLHASFPMFLSLIFVGYLTYERRTFSRSKCR
jgi:hypothetical protein